MTEQRRLRNWSHTSLLNFELCPYLAWLKHGEKLPEGGDPTARNRGIETHNHAEYYVNGTVPELYENLLKFETEFRTLKKLFKKGKVSLEGEWAYTENWEPTDWRSKDAWCRMKLDAAVFPTADHAIVIDYKTGKRFGNEIKHGEQLQIYAFGVFLRYPKVETLEAELWYTDLNEISSVRMTRPQALNYVRPYTIRAKRMTEATTFPPKPNVFSCTRCPYGPNKSGDCKAGFSITNMKRPQRTHH